MRRQDDALLRERGSLPESLRAALHRALDDELPDAARMKRIEAKILFEIASTGTRKRDEADVERWRELAVARSGEKTERHVSPTRADARVRTRQSAIPLGVAMLLGAAAIGSFIVAYRGRHPSIDAAAVPSEPTVPPMSPTSYPPLVTERGEPIPGEPQRIAPSAEHGDPIPGEPQRLAPSAVSAPRDGVAERAPKMVTQAPGPSPSPSHNAPPSSSRKERAPVAAPPSVPRPGDLPNPLPKTPSIPDEAFEVVLLERATRALATDPQTALSLTEQHRATFPHGKLAQEREVVLIQALAKLGRLDAAESVAKRFLAEHPESPYAKDVLNMAGAPRR